VVSVSSGLSCEEPSDYQIRWSSDADNGPDLADSSYRTPTTTKAVRIMVVATKLV
jgi:hypothetical protein